MIISCRILAQEKNKEFWFFLIPEYTIQFTHFVKRALNIEKHQELNKLITCERKFLLWYTQG